MGWVVDRLVPLGPKMTAESAAEVVAELRLAASEAVPLVAAASGLPEADGETAVITRQSWVKANMSLAATMMPDDFEAQRGLLAGVLSVLSSRVLGQYDPTTEKLLLNAPTIIEVEEALAVNPKSFRLWVCLHEQTHRAQFAAAPWLFDELVTAARRVTTSELSGAGLRELIDEVSGVMSLLEGHADVIMDRVDLPATAEIRAAFEARRDRLGLISVLGKVLGLDKKMAQYREGAAFCRAVLDAGGLDLLNRTFEGPEFLPSIAQIRNPQAWIEKHG